MALTPLTELETVNQCLDRIGEVPVNSLTSQNTTIEAEQALRLLRNNSVKLQQKGWHWNTECRTFQPDTDGNIYLPTNTLRVDSVEQSRSLNVIGRGNRLFNLASNTYTFTGAIALQLIVGLEFNELPSSARVFLLEQTKIDFYANIHDVGEVTAVDREQAASAWATLMDEEIENSDSNILWDNNESAIIAGRAFSHPFWF